MLRMSACAVRPRRVAQQRQHRRDHALRAEHVHVEHARASPRGRRARRVADAERAARVVDQRVDRPERRDLVAQRGRRRPDRSRRRRSGGCRARPPAQPDDRARRATPTTSQPRSRNSLAVASPMPELAPVTTTRFAMCPVFPSRLAPMTKERHRARARSPPRPRRSRPDPGRRRRRRTRPGAEAPRPHPVLGQRAVRHHRAGRHRARDPAADQRLEQRADRCTCSSTRSTCRRSRSSAATSRRPRRRERGRCARSSPTSCCRT